MNTFSPEAIRLFPDVTIADNASDRQEVFRLRYDVFCAECHRTPANADHENRLICDPPNPRSYLLQARRDGRCVGTVRLDIGGPEPAVSPVSDWFGTSEFAAFAPHELGFSYQFIVAQEYRRTTVPVQLIYACYWLARHHGLRFLFCGCSPHLLKLYETMGFRRYRHNVTVPGHGYQIPLVALPQDRQHLEDVRSPCRRVVSTGTALGSSDRAWFERRFPRVLGFACENLLAQVELRDYLADRLTRMPAGGLPGLGQKQAIDLLAAGSVLRCRPGDALIEAGQGAGACYVVLDGAAAVTESADGPASEMATVTRGEVTGAAAFVGGCRHRWDHTALTDLEVVALTPLLVSRAFAKDPAAAESFERIVRAAAERFAPETVGNISVPDPCRRVA